MSSSTGHFPGAPINTEPITTMATSTSQPITLPSTASQVTPSVAPGVVAAPASVPGQAAPATTTELATDPKKTATDEPRAQSSASNPGGTDPATTTAATTTTTDPGSTATTSTATTATTTAGTTTGVASTTTTNSTTIVATGRITPTIPQNALFHDMIKRANNCLFLVRKLRSKQNFVTQHCLNGTIPPPSAGFKLDPKGYFDADVAMQEVMTIFDKLNHITIRLPKAVPPTDNVNTMRTLYAQEHTMCHADIKNLFEKMIDCGNWNEGNFQIFHYLAELLRVVNHSRKPNRYPDKIELPRPIFNSKATNGHLAFENAFKIMKKEILNKSLGIYPQTLARTTSSIVLEFLFGHGGHRVLHNSDIVYTMKFLLVERNGYIEYINMIAPHESWKFSDCYSGHKHVDPFGHSCYEVYRRLTKQANVHLQNCFGSHVNRWTALTLLQFVGLFGKFRECFTARCRVCRRTLKNFLPPLIFDIRTPTNAVHDACR